MSDSALALLASMQAHLEAEAPLEGGWHSAPLPGVPYPYGTFFVTRSLRQAGNAWRHSGVVNVWCRQEATEAGNRAARDAYALSAQVLDLLDGGFPVAGLTLFDFLAADPARQPQPDGTWRGWFTFTALST